MKTELIILGCGSSAGVPAITNRWGNCDPDEPKNRRTRPSIAIVNRDTTLIVDTGPDFREQYNREKLNGLTGIIYTHTHADHVHGIDELRTLQRLMKMKFPLHGTALTIRDLQERFGYLFTDKDGGFYPAAASAQEINYFKDYTVGNIPFHTFEQDHGTMSSLGLRVGNIGYSTDMKRLNDQSIETLTGIDIWIADAAANDQIGNPVHACIDEVIQMNQKIGAREVYLTHLPPTMDYQTLMRDLPEGYKPAYDGLRLEITL